jgi:hypothetical protein
MSEYRWAGTHAYNDHANGRVIEPGAELPDEIAERVADAHPYDVEAIDDETEGGDDDDGEFDLDAFLDENASDQVEAIESGAVDNHLSAIQEANAAENEYATVDEAVDERLAELDD